MNIFIKAAIIFVITLIVVSVAFIVVNTPWVTASLAAYAAMTHPADPAVITTPDVWSIPGESICAREVSAYRDVIIPLLIEWGDAVKLAQESPRISLPPSIAHLQEIQREVSKVEPTPCVKDAHTHLLQAMHDMNEGLLAFLGQEGDDVSATYIKTSKAELETALSLLTTAAR